jgi:hypothetical protein
MPGIITMLSPPVFTIQSMLVVWGVSVTWTLVDGFGRIVTVTFDLVHNTYSSPYASGAQNAGQISGLAATLPGWLTQSASFLATSSAMPGTAS